MDGALKLDRARGTPGWMLDEELEWLAQQATSHYRIAEVGSYVGRSTTALAENTRGMVFAIDTWKGSQEHTLEQIGPEGWLFQKFSENTRGLPIFPVMGTSELAARYFEEKCFKLFDMIFIDAAHDSANVRQDIMAWQPLLQKGGILCGHDFGTWPMLAETVVETLGQVKVPVGSIWLKEFEEGAINVK